MDIVVDSVKGFYSKLPLDGFTVADKGIINKLPMIVKFLTKVPENIIWDAKDHILDNLEFKCVGTGSCCIVYNFNEYVLKVIHTSDTEYNTDETKIYTKLSQLNEVAILKAHSDDLLSIFEYIPNKLTELEWKRYEIGEMSQFMKRCIDLGVLPLDLRRDNFRRRNNGDIVCCDLGEFIDISTMNLDSVRARILSKLVTDRIVWKDKNGSLVVSVDGKYSKGSTDICLYNEFTMESVYILPNAVYDKVMKKLRLYFNNNVKCSQLTRSSSWNKN